MFASALRADQRHRAVARDFWRKRARPAAGRPSAARSGQPHRGAPPVRSRPRLIFSRQPTAGPCSRCRSSAISRSSAPPIAVSPAIPRRSRPPRTRSTISAALINGQFPATVSPADVVHAFAGVRALIDDGSKNPQDTAARLCAGASTSRMARRPWSASMAQKIHDLSAAGRGHARTGCLMFSANGRPGPDVCAAGGDFPVDGVERLDRCDPQVLAVS